MIERLSVDDAAARICELHPGFCQETLAEEIVGFNEACEAAMPDPVAVGNVIRLWSESKSSGVVRMAGKVDLLVCSYGEWVAVQMWDIKRDVELLRCNIPM